LDLFFRSFVYKAELNLLSHFKKEKDECVTEKWNYKKNQRIAGRLHYNGSSGFSHFCVFVFYDRIAVVKQRAFLFGINGCVYHTGIEGLV